MFKKILVTLLALALLFSATAFIVSAEEITIQASAMNTGRGEGQLIIYTPEYGAKTNTNEWGYEATVGSDHKVIAVGVNSASIPEGGFVLSGHDPSAGVGMKTWIKNNVKVGMYVYYNPNTLLVKVSDKPLDQDESAFYSSTTSFNSVNGTRTENAMIIYTSAKGSKTGTNEYGYEVSVSGEGLVLTIGGNNTAIPKGGFVVSGHEVAAAWLRANVQIGMSCTYDTAKKTVTFTLNEKTLQSGLESSLNAVYAEMEQSKANYLHMDYNAFETSYKAVQNELKKAVSAYKKDKKAAAFVSACDDIRTSIENLRLSICESVPVQYRAAWLRPSQKSAAEVDAYVEKLYQNGINTVCVEGIFSGCVIMNVPDGSLFEHNPSFSYDVLQAYVDACHKRGMECHLWMAIYHVASKNDPYYGKSLAKKKPQWLALNNKGNTDNEYDFYMIDPANEEAREYLISFYKYIFKNYDIDCFELDYIRYCNRTGSLDFGYTDAAIKGFQAAYSVSEKPTYNTTSSIWSKWVQYRKDCISEMVKEISETLRNTNPKIRLAADVVPNPDEAGATNYQDYLRWEEEGWIDVLHPMAYGDGFGTSIAKQVSKGGSRCAVAVGLGSFMETLGATDMVKQSIQDTQLGAIGDFYFEASAYLADQTGPALLKTAYRNAAIPPFLDSDQSIRELLTYMNAHIENIIVPFKGLTDSEAKAIKDAISAAITSVKDAKIGCDELAELQTLVRKVADKKAKTALETDLYRAEQLSCVIYKCKVSELLKEQKLPEPVSEPEVSEESVEESVEESEEEPADTSEESENAVADHSDETSEADNDSSEIAPDESEQTAQPDAVPVIAWVGVSVAVVAILALLIYFMYRKRKH